MPAMHKVQAQGLVKFFLADVGTRAILELFPIEIVERLNVLC